MLGNNNCSRKYSGNNRMITTNIHKNSNPILNNRSYNKRDNDMGCILPFAAIIAMIIFIITIIAVDVACLVPSPGVLKKQ